MKSAGALKDELITLNALPATASLQQAYSVLIAEQVREKITDHYTCVKAGPTVNRLANQPWRRIYTLNVDNCVEFAFRKLIEAREFDAECIETFNFVDGYSEPLSDKRCSIVHLHGTIERPDGGYVFSRNEYAKTMSRPNSWMLTLSQLIKSNTFVVAGTSFDEIDVEYYLEQRSQKTRRGDVPFSVLIEPYPNKLTGKLCSDHEFWLFEGTVLDFFTELEAVDERIRNPWIDNKRDGLSGLGLDHADRLCFSASFEVIPDEPEKTANPARFLLGAELTWSMVAANTDVPRDVFPEVQGRLVEALHDPECRLLLLIDQPGSGKTSFLKRMAFDISRGSTTVFWYTGLGLELDPRKIARILNRLSEPVVVFVDNFADALNSIVLILKEIDKVDILFVCAERDYRLIYIENAFSGEDYQLLTGRLDLTANEAALVRDVHQSEGISTIQSVPDGVYFGQVVGKTIAEANCRIQNNFRTIDKIAEGLAAESTAEEAAVYLLVSLARFCYALGVRRSILSTVSYPDEVEFLLSQEAALPIKYSKQDGSFVVPKQTLIGDRFLEARRKFFPRRLLTAFTELAESVAPRVNPSTIRRKTPEAQLLGRLMDYDNNVKRFIDEYAEEFYAALKPLCGWNARYWEQMALLKLDRYFASLSDTFLLEESIQHARSAISAEVHPFSLTTLSKVLFQAMDKSPDRRDQFFSESWANIIQADERESTLAELRRNPFCCVFWRCNSVLRDGGAAVWRTVRKTSRYGFRYTCFEDERSKSNRT